MKNLGASLVLVGTLVAGGLASAQSAVSLPAEDTAIVATFYDGNPFGSGQIVVDDFWNDAVKATLDDGAISKRIDGIEDADYVVLNVGGVSLTFNTTGGDSKSSIYLVYDGEALDGDLTLADAVDSVTAALEGDAGLAVFTDADGVVTGLYTYTDAVMPTVDVAEADYVLVSHDGRLESFKTASGVARSLESVRVVNSAGEAVALGSLLT